MNATIIGLDIAKSVFQVHVADRTGEVVQVKKLRRAQVEPFFARHPRALVGIEACGSAHYWGRTLRALGHDVRLIPAAYVRPFVNPKLPPPVTRKTAGMLEFLRYDGWIVGM